MADIDVWVLISKYSLLVRDGQNSNRCHNVVSRFCAISKRKVAFPFMSLDYSLGQWT